jgi:hypothetical protein
MKPFAETGEAIDITPFSKKMRDEASGLMNSLTVQVHR